MWVWPPFLVFWSTKARSAYGIGPSVRRRRAVDGAAPARPPSAARRGGARLRARLRHLVDAAVPADRFPALVWLVWRRPGVLRLSHYAVAGGVVGAAPWIAWNLTHGLKGVLPVTSVAGEESTYFSPLRRSLHDRPARVARRCGSPTRRTGSSGRRSASSLTAPAVAFLLVAFARRPPGRRAAARDRRGLPVSLRGDVVHVLHGRAAVPDLHRAGAGAPAGDAARAVRASRSERCASRSRGRPSTSCGSRTRDGSATSVSPRTWRR